VVAVLALLVLVGIPAAARQLGDVVDQAPVFFRRAADWVEGAVISPRIVGESVGLHPVWVVFALALGGFFFGFVGLLVAVPAAVGIKLLVQRGVARYRTSELYLGEMPAGS
jgi:predicted PurR-regulated permease PerM